MKTKVIITVLLAALSASCAQLEVNNGRQVAQGEAPNVTEAFTRAETLYKAGELLSARDLYIDVVERVPEHLFSLFRLGNIEQRLGSLASAENYYEKVLDINPAYTRAHYNLSVVMLLQARQHYATAMQTSEHAIPKNPDIDRRLGP